MTDKTDQVKEQPKTETPAKVVDHERLGRIDSTNSKGVVPLGGNGPVEEKEGK